MNPLEEISFIVLECRSCGEIDNVALGQSLCNLCSDELKSVEPDFYNDDLDF